MFRLHLFKKLIISAVLMNLLTGCAPQTGTPTLVGEQTHLAATMAPTLETRQSTSAPTSLAPTRSPNNPQNLAAATAVTDKNLDHLVGLGFVLRGSVRDMAGSADGRWLSVCAPGSGVALYELASLQEKWFHPEGVDCSSVRFSPAGNLVAIEQPDSKLHLLDIRTGQELPGPDTRTASFMFTSDGKTIIVYTEDPIPANPFVYTVDGKPVLTLLYKKGVGLAGILSPDGSLTASLQTVADNKRGIEIDLFPSGERKAILFVDGWDYIFSFTPDSTRLMVMTNWNTVQLWGLDGKLTDTISFGDRYIYINSVQTNGKYLLSTLKNDENVDPTGLVVWDASTKKQVQSFIGYYNFAAITPDGRYLAAFNPEGIHVWDLQDGTSDKLIEFYNSSILKLTFSPPGQNLTAVTNNLGLSKTFVTTWDWQMKQKRASDSIDVEREQTRILAFTPDQTKLIYQKSPMLDIWQYDLASRKDAMIREFSGVPMRMVSQVGFSTAAKLLMLPLDLPGADKIPDGTYTLSPDGALLAIQTEDNRVVVWDVANQKVLLNPNMPATSAVKHLAFTKNSKNLVIAAQGFAIQVFQTAPPFQIRTLTSPVMNTPMDVDFALSLDESALALVYDCDVLLIPFSGENASSGTLAHSGTNCFNSVAFSADGKFIAAGSYKGTVQLWMVDPTYQPPQPKTHSLNVMLVSPPDKSVLDTLHPKFTVKAVGLDAGGHLNLNIDLHGLGTSFETSPKRELYEDVFEENFDPGKTYTWDVSYQFLDGTVLKSEKYTFTTPSNGQIPGQVTLLSPQNETTDLSSPDGKILVEWQSVDGAADYYVCISNRSTHVTSCSYTAKTQDTVKLASGTRYEWYVKARNPYAYGQLSPTWTFSAR